MIITITGKPCSGKGTVGKLFCEKYGYEYLSTGDQFRKIAQEYGCNDILEFQQKFNMEEVDKLVDSNIEKLGKEKLNENILIDSRLAWHFIPKSFKVFIDVDLDTAAERLINSERETEQAENLEHAKSKLVGRWKTENDRFKKIYNVTNLDLKNYNFVISSKDKTPEKIVEEIYKSYKKYEKHN